MIVLIDPMTPGEWRRATNQVRAIIELRWELRTLIGAQRRHTRDQSQKAFLFYTANQIKHFQEDPKKMNLPSQAIHRWAAIGGGCGGG
jgi:hypothetical protein